MARGQGRRTSPAQQERTAHAHGELQHEHYMVPGDEHDHVAESDTTTTKMLVASPLQIAAMTDLREVIAGMTVAQAAETYAAAIGAPERQWQATITRLRLERKADELWKLEGKDKAGRPNQSGQPGPIIAKRGTSGAAEAEFVVPEHAPKRWALTGSVPDGRFEQYVENAWERGRDSGWTEGEPSRAGLVDSFLAKIMHSSADNEWYTPAQYIEAARRAMGRIDVDPASSQIANETVGATTYFTQEDDGLTEDWRGNVWLNPPYGKAGPKFVARLVEQHRIGNTIQAIIVVNEHCTDAGWFRPFWDHLLCFTYGRVNFLNPSGELSSGSTHGAVFVYFGDRREAFATEFERFGAIVERYRG